MSAADMASSTASAPSISSLIDDLNEQVKCAKVSNADLFASFHKDLRRYLESGLQSEAFAALYDLEDCFPDHALDAFAYAARDDYAQTMEKIAELEGKAGLLEPAAPRLYLDLVSKTDEANPLQTREIMNHDYHNTCTGTLVVLRDGRKFITGQVRNKDNLVVTPGELVYYVKTLNLVLGGGHGNL